VADLLDRWDSGGNDAEGGIVVLVLCVGLGFLLRVAAARGTPLVRAARRPAGTNCIASRNPASAIRRAGFDCIAGPPVLPLRV
jgi:hypothetical protein